jgi:hypothetical protein
LKLVFQECIDCSKDAETYRLIVSSQPGWSATKSPSQVFGSCGEFEEAPGGPGQFLFCGRLKPVAKLVIMPDYPKGLQSDLLIHQRFPVGRAILIQFLDKKLRFRNSLCYPPH